jgi:DNA gyrase subunit B
MASKKIKNQYSADSIQALEGIEHVRKRPSMYIGDLSTRGLHHLVYEVVDNSIDEAMAGHCSEISIQINTDKSISIEDNGRGIPVGIHKKEGVSALEVVMTKIGAGGKFDKDSYKVSGGLHGVGVSVVNALSEVLTANVYRDGKEYQQIYKKGKPDSKVKEIGKSDKKGTLVTFKPDKDIFKEVIDFEYDILSNRMRELSFLNKGITISITDNREETKKR